MTKIGVVQDNEKLNDIAFNALIGVALNDNHFVELIKQKIDKDDLDIYGEYMLKALTSVDSQKFEEFLIDFAVAEIKRQIVKIKEESNDR